ncbi:MAG: hypothetical protein M3340_18360, partial [Actinomycetota bacterium]|nr:hypothetical protein [Actinomycetota bacterium]
PVSGPVLAGDRVVWADARRDGGFDVRSALVAGGDRRTLLTMRGHASEYFQPRLAASAQVVAVEAIEHQRGRDDPQRFSGRFTFAGPPTGPLDRVGERCGLSETVRPRSIDVSGDSFAYMTCGRRIEVRRIGSPLPPEQFDGNLRGLRLAGRYVAWVDRELGGVTVYDRMTRGAAYHLDEQRTGGVGGIDLADDGTVAIGSLQTLSVASPAEPSMRGLPVAGERTYHPTIAGGTVAFSRARDRSRPGPGGEVGTVRLDGGERLLARGPAFDVYEPTADFDGSRVAYFTYNCSDATIHVVDADSAARSFGQRRGCPFALARAPRVKSSLRAVLLDIDCFGFDGETCGAERIELTRDGRRMGSARFGTTVPLTAAARAALRRTGRLRVRATGIFRDRPGRRERRTSTLTLKRPGS